MGEDKVEILSKSMLRGSAAGMTTKYTSISTIKGANCHSTPINTMSSHELSEKTLFEEKIARKLERKWKSRARGTARQKSHVNSDDTLNRVLSVDSVEQTVRSHDSFFTALTSDSGTMADRPTECITSVPQQDSLPKVHEIDKVREILQRRRSGMPLAVINARKSSSSFNINTLPETQVEQDNVQQCNKEKDTVQSNTHESAIQQSGSVRKLQLMSVECKKCSFINELIKSDVCSSTTCTMCEEPIRFLSKKYSEKNVNQPRTLNQANTFDESWSNLQGVINQAALMSIQDNKNIKRFTTERLLALGESGGEIWLCKFCTYQNLDKVAIFCGVCGSERS